MKAKCKPLSLQVMSAALYSVFFVFCLSACEPKPIVTNTLTFVTRNSPATYYETLYGPAGFEYDLAKSYAQFAGKELTIISADSIGDIFNALNTGSANIAAAGLTATEQRARYYHFSPSYMEVKQYILYRYGTYRPRSIEKLTGRKLKILANSSHEASLISLSYTHPSLDWFSDKNTTSALDLLGSLRRGETDHILVDSNEYDLYKSMFPSIGIAFSIKRQDQLVWMMGAQQDNHLLASVNTFFKSMRESGQLEALIERHYGHTSHIGRNDSKTFANRVEHRLPELETLIKTVALEEGFDWRLLAAISYQESHWNPKAKSPTGVRGLMMLTRVTAKEVGVEDRTDAEQSLRGGLQYFKKIHKRLPKDIIEPDRTWLALAGYNVGYGHLADARILTERHGGDPDLWLDVMVNLPLLRQRDFYSTTKHGYARGNEPVVYVQRIRNYYSQLAWRERNEDFMLALSNVDKGL